MGPGFVLPEKDERRLAQLITGAETDPDLNGLEALGWYHSHIRSRIFLSERDRQIQCPLFRRAIPNCFGRPSRIRRSGSRRLLFPGALGRYAHRV